MEIYYPDYFHDDLDADDFEYDGINLLTLQTEDELCSECGRETVGDTCEECGIPLCQFCASSQGMFCEKHPSESYLPTE